MMLTNSRRWIAYGLLSLLAVAGLFFFYSFGSERQAAVSGLAVVTRGSIRMEVSTTGMVEPRNRLKIQPSVSGRVETIMVMEGDAVRRGEVLALMSSSERAALLDAALLKGEEELSYWRSVYRENAVVAPIDGQVIVRSIEPGQGVTTADSLFVLSDRLIVKAYVDETDIGLVRVGQKAHISLDAYPEINVMGVVSHIDYESHMQNNVTMYYVDIDPDVIPPVFRSGMSANIDIVIDERSDVLLLPAVAVHSENGRQFVRLATAVNSDKVESVKVLTGLSEDGLVEITAGLHEQDRVYLPDTSMALSAAGAGSNPFMPKRPKKSK